MEMPQRLSGVDLNYEDIVLILLLMEMPQRPVGNVPAFQFRVLILLLMEMPQRRHWLLQWPDI